MAQGDNDAALTIGNYILVDPFGASTTKHFRNTNL